LNAQEIFANEIMIGIIRKNVQYEQFKKLHNESVEGIRCKQSAKLLALARKRKAREKNILCIFDIG
jgi:hypothetical protein